MGTLSKDPNTPKKCPLVWQGQEPPFDHPDSCWHYRLDSSKPVVATRAATFEFTREEILGAFEFLQQKAVEHRGLDYIQTFKDRRGRRLWVIENEEAITAMLPEDY